MYVIRKFRAGEDQPEHGRMFNNRSSADIWMARECEGEGYWARCAREAGNGEAFIDDYRIRGPHDTPEVFVQDRYVVMWEDEPEVNEFGLVSP